MDPPSLDPPPDDDYGRTDAAGTFAGDHVDRRSIIFVGTNEGMVHAIDARTGYEIWAYIPYNLLPKLKTLLDGQPVEDFDYFVDSSPKIAELKMNGDWRSFLFIGEGPGGVFYQGFDVTDAGMNVPPDADGIGAVTSLLNQFDSPNESIQFLWSFPNYSSFDPDFYAEFPLTDGTAGDIIKFYGDLKATATTAEKSVGFTWSDPAVGPLNAARDVNALIVGSGYFPDVEDLLVGRGAGSPRAGRSLYLIDAETGTLVGNPGGGPCGGVGCLDVGDIANVRKNALQGDPSAAGESGSYVVSKAYLGDLDGEYWRFNFDDSGTITPNEMVFADQPIYASSALLFVGSTDVYMFFATGSDLLPVTATGGTGTFRLIGLKDNAPGGGATTKFVENLSPVIDVNGYAVGERPSTSPSVAGDIVFYTTSIQDDEGYVTSNLYALTYLGGAAYDSTGDGVISNNESPVVRNTLGRASAPFIVDQHLYFASSGEDGASIEILGDPEDFNNGVGQVGVRILSWRELR
jgi:Tfp pilus tip-associated adhesin PilY1